MKSPDKEAYSRERKKRGTQAAVAKKLGVHRVTIAKRESGLQPVTREAWLALLSIEEEMRKPVRMPSVGHINEARKNNPIVPPPNLNPSEADESIARISKATAGVFKHLLARAKNRSKA